ncbi:MAG: HAMP domain-containing histidine kinase [Candidatus Omnitrophica bacterium]|nr:HAMP domain-containing histidine kinase [Candidatus Omnitrophota bacterium]
MSTPENSYQAAHELGRIYDAVTDRKVLVDFFLATVFQLIPADRGYLFLATPQRTLLLDASEPACAEMPLGLSVSAQEAFAEGKPVIREPFLFLPVIARNTAMGIACFERNPGRGPFGEKDMEIGFDLVSEFSGALKNILLFEENLKMERLAAVGQAMGMVIHELKNIMQLTRFSDEMIRIGLKEKNEGFLTKGLEKMARSLKEMDGFASEMLSLTKDYQLEPAPMNVPALLEELDSDLSEKARGNHIRLDFQTEADFPEVEGDARAIYRALLNLIKNAFEAFQDRAAACVKVRARVLDDTSYEILVEDNAAGMTEEVKARLFEAFFSTKGKRGTGLGLLVVARTVKMHRGNIRVESSPGLGTKFFLTLPRSSPKPA